MRTETIKYKGKIFQVVDKEVQLSDGKTINFEIARRAPGVRMIFTRERRVGDTEILLTREYRYELSGYDYRLPGGKVFDKLQDYLSALENNEDMETHALAAVKRESKEECGLVPHSSRLIKHSKNGATVEWDLYYYYIDSFEELQSGQQLESGEDITVEWHSTESVTALAKSGKINEDRSLGVLLTFII
jgi:8-oxo-dGTP pyrophosphatase MutT (NUDIX family)